MIAFTMNIILALIWLMLRKDPGILDFIAGFIIGFFVIIPFSRLLKGSSYIRRVVKFIQFLSLFLIEFIKSNLSVAYVILFVPKSTIKPSFFDFDIKDLNFFETLILSYCITLTPGTISVKIDKEKDILVVHCLDTRSLKVIKSNINRKFVQNILGFTR